MGAISKGYIFHQPILAALEQGRAKAVVVGTAGSFPAFISALLLRDLRAPLLLVTPTGKEAQRLYEDLNFYLRFLEPEEPGQALLFPSEESPYLSLSITGRAEEGIKVSCLTKLLE